MLLWIEIIGADCCIFRSSLPSGDRNKLGGKFSISEVFGVKVEEITQRPVVATLSPEPRGVG
jgi:hypothetical protein